MRTVFEKSEHFGYSSLRRQKTEQVAFSLRTSGSHEADQSAIWEEIDRKHASMGTHYPTAALNEVYKNQSGLRLRKREEVLNTNFDRNENDILKREIHSSLR